MRVLFTVWPATAHLYPVVPLAWALQSAGHEVCVASHPALAPTITSVGLTAVSPADERLLPPPTGAGKPFSPEAWQALEDVTRTLAVEPADHDLWRFQRDYMLPAIRDFHPVDATAGTPQPWLDGLVEFCRSWRPDLVLWDPTMPSSAVAARTVGAAHARFLWGLDHFAWSVDRFTARRNEPGDGPAVEEPLIASVRPMAERYGLEPDDELLFGQWTVDPMPAPMRLPTTRRTVPMRWVPYTGPDTLPDWLWARPERPRVALTLGASMRAFRKDSESLVGDLLETVAGLDAEVVATFDATQLTGIERLPGNVRTVDYVPLAALLPTCTAAIHHGGYGTLCAVAAAGLPQVVAMDGDEVMEGPISGRFLTDSGAGLTLRREELSVAGMREQLERVLNEPSFRKNAAAVHADMLAAPGPTEIIPALERLTASLGGAKK
ncbi:nucleotide disphospho-sugar-binding domain-containing protein [Streptomyces sp. NPDC000405]|uniref:nucleotide disphospho-sugar-binding domain-containing protein n=1 Tax=Streptomyces sp. NPDC000405 TaxID=3161033 RepID=UPI00398D646F